MQLDALDPIALTDFRTLIGERVAAEVPYILVETIFDLDAAQDTSRFYDPQSFADYLQGQSWLSVPSSLIEPVARVPISHVFLHLLQAHDSEGLTFTPLSQLWHPSPFQWANWATACLFDMYSSSAELRQAGALSLGGAPANGRVSLAAANHAWLRAAMCQQESAAERGLAAGANIDVYDPLFGLSALAWSAYLGGARLAEKIVEWGGNVTPDAESQWQSPIHNAARWGMPSLMKVLVDRGADPHLRLKDEDEATEDDGGSPPDQGQGVSASMITSDPRLSSMQKYAYSWWQEEGLAPSAHELHTWRPVIAYAEQLGTSLALI